MIRTLWKAAAPGRVGMIASVAIGTMLARLSAVFMPAGEWAGSERQDLYGTIVLWFVLPVFSAMLGATLLRGEHAPWSWGMARPVSRARLLGAMAALDAATIAGCAAFALLMLGGFGTPPDILGARAVATIATFVLYPALYLAVATAGAWTSSSVRAAGLGVGALALPVLITMKAFATPSFDFVGAEWRYAYFGQLFPAQLNDLSLLHPLVLASPAALTAAAALPIGLMLGFLRAAKTVPARPRPLVVLRPALLCFAAALTLIATAYAVRSAMVPSEARMGHATLVLRVTGELPVNEAVQSLDLRYASGLASQPEVWKFAHRATKEPQRWEATQLSPGEYRVCARVRALDRGDKLRAVCAPVTVTSATTQMFALDVGSR